MASRGGIEYIVGNCDVTYRVREFGWRAVALSAEVWHLSVTKIMKIISGQFRRGRLVVLIAGMSKLLLAIKTLYLCLATFHKVAITNLSPNPISIKRSKVRDDILQLIIDRQLRDALVTHIL